MSEPPQPQPMLPPPSEQWQFQDMTKVVFPKCHLCKSTDFIRMCDVCDKWTCQECWGPTGRIDESGNDICNHMLFTPLKASDWLT